MKKHLLSLCVAILATSMSLNARTVLIDDGFENGIQDSVWTQENVQGNMPWAVEDIADGLSHPSTVYQGTKRAYLRNNTGETQGYVTRLISKVMDLRPTKVYMPELTFWYANPKWGADRDTLRVLYRTGSHSAWKQLAEFSTAMSDWTKVKLALPEVGSTYQIAFEGSDNLGRGIVLDSIKVQSAPECTIPYDIMTTNRGAGRVNIAWTASYDADYFELVVCKDTIDPDLADEVAPDRMAFHGLVSDVTNIELTLETGEHYLVYARSLCESENSAWSSEASAEGPYGFWVRTAKQIPFTERFNDLAGQKDPTRIPEWTWGSNTNNPNPYVNTTTRSAITKANYSPDSTAAVIFSGGSTLEPSVFIPADRYVYLATPALADTTKPGFSINQCQVTFWSTVYTNTGRQYGSSLMVGVMTDPEDITTFVPVDTVTVWNNKTFQENIVDLSTYYGNGAYLAFVSDFDRENLFYIDNITVEYKKAVNKVTKISVNPRDTYADITWEGNASSYNVLVTNTPVANPSNPAAAAIVAQATVNTNSYHCTGLEADHSWNRPYYVYVQAAGTEWSYRYPFVTIAAKRAIPYSFDFESRTPVYNIESGDQTVYAVGLGVFGNSGAYPSVESNASKSYAGSGYLYLNKRGGTDAWFTLPMVDKLDSVQVKFYLSGNDTYLQAHATIGIMSNPMDINTFVPVSSFKLNTSGYTRCYANFENYQGPDGVIAIVWDDVMNMSQNTINYIDELTVEELSECVPPTDLELEIEPDSVTVRWESALSDEWEFFISRTPLTESQRMHKTLDELAAMASVVVAQRLEWNDPATTPVFGFGNLLSHTNYYIYIRATCDLDWWTEMAFATPCRAETFPYKEMFENYNVGSTAVGCWQLADYMGVDYPRIYQAGTTTASNKTLELYSSGTIHRTVAILPEVEGSLSSMLLSIDARTYEGTAGSEGLLYIGTMEDITNKNSFVPFATIPINNGSAFTKIRLDLSQYDLVYENIAITTGLGALVMNSHVIIDNVELKDPGCIEAYDYVQVGAEPNSIDVTWSGLTPTDTWEVKLLTQNVAISAIKNGMYNRNYAVVDDTIVSGKALHVGGLQAKRNYYVYVRALCGDSIWTTSPVYTSCDLLDPAKGNKETFDSYSSGTSYAEAYHPDCWSYGNGDPTASTTYIPYIYNSTTYSNSGANTFRMYGYSSYTPAYVVSPAIKCTNMKEVAVTFYMYCSSSYAWVCGVMSDPHDLSTFVVIDSVRGTGNSVQYSYDLGDYENIIPADARYFAWRTPYNMTSYAYLDDVSFVSVACPLTKPSVSELTTSSARISSGLRTDDQWILLVTNREITEENLNKPGYVIPSSYIVVRDTVDRRSKTITNLRGQTKYFVATATLCSDTVMSQWSLTNFTTPCEAKTPEQLGTITFSEEEGFTTGTNGEMPCWTVGSKTAGVSASYIPYIEATTGTKHNGNNYLKIYDYKTSSASNVGAYAIMPELNVDSINKYQINFWGRSNSSSSYGNKVIVGIVSDPSDLNTFVPMDTLILSKSAWDPYSVSFENYLGDYMGDFGRNIMFLSDFDASNYAYISEISVELIPTCRPISSFSVDSVGENQAIISWKGHQDRYRLLLSDKALKEDEKASYMYLKDTIVTSSQNVVISDLFPNSNYFVYAQGICDYGDSTAISMVYASIHTTCPTEGGSPLPFFDDFESYELDDPQPGCWQLLHTGSYTSYFAVKSVSSNGTKAIDVYSTSDHGCYMIVPKVDADLSSTKLSFDARSYGGSSATKMFVGVMSDVNDVTTFVLLKTFDLAATSTFTHCEMDLGDYDLVYDNLVLTAGIAGVTPSTYDVYLDNVGLELLTTCNAPKLKSKNVTFNSINVAITPSKPEDRRWELVIIPEETHEKIANITAYLNNAPSTIVNVKEALFENLEPATAYYIYARTLCIDEYSESTWMRTPLKIHTQFYYSDSYFFGFEKTNELWDRSPYSESDLYYIHPALVSGRDSAALPSQAFIDYPHSRENTETQLYSRTDDGALLMYSMGDSYGGYIIFPPIENPTARSFEFKVRSGYLSAAKYPRSSYNGLLEIGTIDKNTTFDTYQPLATVRINALDTAIQGKGKNNLLYSYYTLDADSVTIANKQFVLHTPKQPSDTSYLFIDDVTMAVTKGYSLVALKKVVAEGNKATVEWYNIGGPWNLYIRDANGATVNTYLNLTGVTSQVVENLNERSDYTAYLQAAGVNSGSYITSDQLAFRTLCEAKNPSSYSHDFVWDFDDSFEWEPNNVLGGDNNDSLYYKPGCFNVGITYNKPLNGYQWLIQRKGYEYYGAQTGYNASRKFEVGRNDSKSLRISTTAATSNSYIVLPELNCGFDSMMIEFYGRCFANYDQTYGTPANRGKIADVQYLSPAYSQSIVVGTLTDPKDLSTLHVLDTLTYAQTNLTVNDNVNDDPTGLRYWELMQLPLADVQGKYIVLFQPAPGLFFIDDLAVKPVGNTLFKPSGLQTSDITPTSATLSWNVRHPSMSSVVVVLDASGAEIARQTVAGTTYPLTGLQPAKNYQWYVYQTDGSANSPAAKAVSFATECVAITPDYTCGFEPEEGVKNIEGQTAYKQTLCWVYGDALNDGWSSATYGPYNQSNTGNAKYSHTGSNAVMMRALSGSRSYQPYIAMPAMDVQAFDTLQVKFWMRPAYVNANTGAVATSYTASNYSKSLIVGTMTDPTDAATFVPLDTVTYDGSLSTADVASEANNYLFQQMKVELVGATGPYVAIMTSFVEKGSTSKKTGDYVWVDDITFEHKQECKDPTNLQALFVAADFATLTWNDIDSAGTYILQVSTDPYFADESAFAFNHEVETNTYTVEGLQPLTTYVWRVQALCGEKWGNSSFTAKESFKTVRSPFFLEEFNAAVSANEWTFSKTHADIVVDSTAMITRGVDDWGFLRVTTSYGLEGSHYASKGYSGDYHWMITPTFYLPEDDSVHFSMDLALTALNSAHAITANAVTNNDMKDDYYFMIIVSDDGGATWKSKNILAKWQNTNPEGKQLRDISSTGQKVRFSLAPYAGKNVRIGFYREAKSTSSTGIAIHVDNVRLAYFDKTSENASTCQYEDVTIGNITLSGDDATPGMHQYPICYYMAKEAAQAGARDSVHAIEIEVYPAEETNFSDTICQGDTYTNYDFQPKSRTGIYRRKLKTVEHGCDSIVTLDLYVIPTTYAPDVVDTLCQGETMTWNGKVYNRAGLYRDTLVSAAGCDSIETLSLTYYQQEGEIRVGATVKQDKLPYEYENEEYPYAAGQAPIYYAAGTPIGKYTDTVRVYGANGCERLLIHTLFIEKSQGLDDIFDDSRNGARKVIYRDQLYIILNDEWYNAEGKHVGDPRK